MKKLVSILLMLLMIISMIPLALADENETEDVCETNDDCDEDEVCTDGECEGIVEEDECTTDDDCDEDEVCTDGECENIEGEVDEETEEEVEGMYTPHGAEVRLLQLEKAIDRNIARGQHIIDATKEEQDVTDLEAIIALMEVLLTEVQDADPSAEDAVEQFVDLKKDAIDLSKQFRDTARELLGPSEAGRLRERIKEIHGEQAQRLRARIKQKIHQYNGEQVGKICEILEIDCEDLKEQLEALEATKEQIREQIKEKIEGMSKEEKKETFAELKEEGIKRNVFKKAAVDRTKYNMFVREEARLNKRLNQLNKIEDPEKRALARERLTNRLQIVNQAEVKALRTAQKPAGISRPRGGDEE